MAVPAHHVESMSKLVQPATKRDLRSFLGAISYYRKFIPPSFSLYSYKLTPATAKTAPNTVSWSEEMLESFHYLRSVLCHVCSLYVPVETDDFFFEN